MNVDPTQPTGTAADEQIEGVASLGDPLRRSLYRFVGAQPGPVNRDQVAEGTGVARHVVKFHLDKLVEEGLLVADYARPAGRGGPGAGRPAKLYRRSLRELNVSLPQREYELAGRMLATAVTAARHDGVDIDEALTTVAEGVGRDLGRQVRQGASDSASDSAVVDGAMTILQRCGYEPRCDGGEIILANCPFHRLSEDFTELVCSMNLDLLKGLVAELDVPKLEARLEPAAPLCCVRIATHPGEPST